MTALNFKNCPIPGCCRVTAVPRAALLALLCIFLSSTTQAQTVCIHRGTTFIWYTTENIWTNHQADISAMFDYMDREFAQTVSDWGIAPPRRHYYLWVDPQTGGGFATGNIGEISDVTGQPAPGIGVAYDAYFNTAYGIKRFWAYAIGTHETQNLLTGQSLSAGWPRDWWADDKSPFPGMSAVRVEAELGLADISAAHDADFGGSRLYAMMKGLQSHYGWSIFRNAFAQVKADGIQWTALDHGYNPSAILTAYVTAYLVMGSGDTLSNLDANFFNGVIPGYRSDVTAQVLSAWDNWKHHGGDGQSFLNGDYLSVGGFPDFSLTTFTPDTLTLAPGGTASTAFRLADLDGFSRSIHLATSRLPAGVTASFAPLGTDRFQMTLSARADAPTAASTIRIIGASEGVPLSAGHSLTLPVIVSINTAQIPVNLAPVATLYGVGNDHLVLGDNGGIDGHGWAYSGVLLGDGLAWGTNQFAVGIPANGEQGTYNAVTGITIPLPAGHYSSLKMLGSANGGSHPDQTFRVNYTDGSSTTFTQSLSDWTAPENYPGETIVATMPYSDVNLGTFSGNRYLYGYIFPLDPGKTVSSFRLPGDNPLPRNSGVVAIAFTLNGTAPAPSSPAQ